MSELPAGPITVRDMERAWDDLRNIALAALMEARADLTIDQSTPPALRQFLIAMHRSPLYHAQIVRETI